mgnify:CR=1 FL=1
MNNLAERYEDEHVCEHEQRIQDYIYNVIAYIEGAVEPGESVC